MEKFELVDKNGNKTGKVITNLDICNPNNIPDECYLPVVGVVIINHKNEILLEKRSMLKKSNPGKWGICGGKINLGETPIDAALRETLEEIGVNIEKDKIKVIREAANGKGYFIIFYIKKDIDIKECRLKNDEVEELRYFRVEELEELDNEGFEWLDNLKKILSENKGDH